jgi:hypothetical protein
MASATPAILDKLAALELERRAAIDKRRQDQQELQNPQESIEQFLQQFKESKERVESSIEQLASAAASEDDVSKKQAQEQIDAVASEVLDLERSVADASYFLPSYDQRAAAASISDLKQRVEGVRNDLVPKKKFAFSRKVNRVKASSDAATAAASSSDTQAPTSAASADQGTARTDTAAASSSSPTSYITEYDQELVKSGRGLQGLRDQVVIKTAADLCGQDYVLLDLHGCTIYLLGPMPALRLHTLRNCTLYTGPITGAVFVNDVQHCSLYLATYQCRVHHTHHTDLYLRVKSKPIIEHTDTVRVAPYELQQLGDAAMQQAAEAAGLGGETGMWCQVDDFGWIKASQSPHWGVVPEPERGAARPPGVQQ